MYGCFQHSISVVMSHLVLIQSDICNPFYSNIFIYIVPISAQCLGVTGFRHTNNKHPTQSRHLFEIDNWYLPHFSCDKFIQYKCFPSSFLSEMSSDSISTIYLRFNILRTSPPLDSGENNEWSTEPRSRMSTCQHPPGPETFYQQHNNNNQWPADCPLHCKWQRVGAKTLSVSFNTKGVLVILRSSSFIARQSGGGGLLA